MNTSMIVPFNSFSENQLSMLGGKGANLVRLTKAGFPVPNGFCITTAAYQKFMDHHHQSDEVFHLLATVDQNDVQEIEKTGKKIRDLLGKGGIPQEISEEVGEIFKQFPPNTRFAVRSSATAEDLPDASFAGQQDTYLNIIGFDALLEHIKKCWISLFTDRAITYRIQQAFDHQDVKLSVVVQEMVESEASGILFTANPLTSNRGEVVINAGFGLGEALVSGIITPDTYTVNKTKSDEIQVEIGSKHAAIQYAAKGGTEEISLPVEKQNAQVLTTLEIQQLAELGKQIEDHYGNPQDIEWAKVNGKFYILQSRPITTLFPIPVDLIKDGKEHVYASFGHLQMMTDTISPLGRSIIQWVMPFGKNQRSTLYSPLITQAGGRIYFDISYLLQNAIINKKINTVMSQVDPLMYSAMANVIDKEQKRTLRDVFRMRFLFRWLLPIVSGAIYNLFFGNPQKLVPDVKQRMENWIEEYTQHIMQSETLQDKLIPMNGFRDRKFIHTILKFPPRIFPGLLALQFIPKLLKDEDVTAELQAIQRSIYDNITTEMDLQIGDLADLIKQNPQQREDLLKMENGKAAESILQILESPTNKTTWDTFMRTFGHRGPGEIDIHQKRWYENKEGVATMIMGNLSNPEIGAHRRHIQNIHRMGDEAAERLLTLAIEKPFGELRANLIKRMILWIRYGLGARENPKYYMIKIMNMIKELLKEQADSWVAQGILQTQDDIFWLSLQDVFKAMQEEKPDIQAMVDETKRKYKQYKKLVPPRLITSSGIIPPVTYNRDDIPENALPGNPVSAGETVGIARVILDPHKETIQAGEILIAPFTDPGWTPLFVHATGLVMELGGSMTHGSVVAREYGIPAVAGVINATQLIKSGMKIRVDGNKGFVEILEQKNI